jgi:uncharacterized repeat protein (TIGR01451 family)
MTPLVRTAFAAGRILLVAAVLASTGAFGSPAASASPSFSTVTEFQPALGAGRIWGGRTVAITVDPGDSNSAIAASESGGLFKTSNLGANWTHIDTLVPFRMSDVKYAPGDRQIVIATASSDSGRKVNGGGIWRSTDGGVTWSKPATSNPPCNARANAYGIAFEANSSNVYVGTDCGVAVSNDRGATWTHVALAQTLAIAASPGGIVDTCSTDGHHRSTNSGGSFGAATNLGVAGSQQACPTSGAFIVNHAIDVSPFEANVLFAVTRAPCLPPEKPGGPPRSGLSLGESDDGGTTWTELGCASGSRSPWVAVHPSTNGVANNFDLYWSGGLDTRFQTCTGFGGPGNRCGASPASANVSVDHADHMGVAFSTTNNCALYLASDGGVERTGGCGSPFSITGGGAGGYNALQIYELTGQVHPSSTDLYFGTQDNDIWASGDNGATWTGNECCEGFFFQIPHSSPTNGGQKITGAVCSGCFNFLNSALFGSQGSWNNPPSTQGGNPFLVGPGVYVQFAQQQTSPGSPGPPPVPPTFSPNQSLYITTDTGGSWTRVPMTGPAELVENGDLSVGINPRVHISGPASDPTIFLAYTRPVPGNPAGLLKITGARTSSATVTDISTGGVGLNSVDSWCDGQGSFLCTNTFGVDPNDPNHIIAADGGSEQMKVSTDGGNTWSVNNELTNLVTANGQFDFRGQAHVIAFDNSNSSLILVGTEAAGIIASTDGGQTWASMPGSQRVTAVTSFFFDEVTPDIIVSSYGRGLWKLSIPSADLSITKSHHPEPAIAGQELYYDLSVTNNGPAGAPQVKVTDTLPAEVTFVTSTAACSATGGTEGEGGQTVTCTLGEMGPSTTKSFTIKVAVNTNAIAASGPKAITNTATVSSAGSVDPELSNNTATDTAIVEDLADLEVTKLCKPDTSPSAGQPITCTVFVDNHGPSDARGAVLTDAILGSSPFTISNIATSQGSCGAPSPTTGGEQFVCNLGVLPAATTLQPGRATVTYTLSSNEGQDINNVASVRSDTPDPNPSNNTATVPLTVSAVSDLSLTKSAPASIVAGTGPLTWTLTIGNAGPSTAKNVVVEDAVPAGVVITSVSGSGSASCTTGVPGDPLQPAKCSFGSLPAGAGGNRTMTVQATVKSGTKGTLQNDARISSDTFDPNSANNLTYSLTTVNQSADLAIGLTSEPTPTQGYKPSSTIHYTVTVNNLGPSDAEAVVVTVTLPPLKSGQYVKDDGGCSLSNVTLTCPLGTFVASGPTRTIHIDWFVQGTKTAVTTTASVASKANPPTPDPVEGNNTTSVTINKK